ncbi:hypothetical protein FS749_016371, partial [Ceratobasidium sp. UAMH 11750]
RLARAKTQPRNLECLRAPDPAAWNGLGRRKRRSRAFEEIGHAFNTRQRLAGIPPPVQSTPVDIQTLHTSPPAVPSRPATPPGLREAVFGCVGLLASASGVNAYGHNTPYPMPPLPTRVIRQPPSPLPPPQPQLAYEGETIINGQPVDCYLAYVMTMGRWEGCKWGRPQSLRQAAQSVLDTDELQPGVLDALIDIFFPHGLGDWSQARPKLLYLKDFVLGWYALAPEHSPSGV